MSTLRITIIQTPLHSENIKKNILMFSEKIDSIAEQTDLIVLPEMFNTEFSMKSKELSETMNGRTIQWMKKKANEKNCVITGSLIISENNNFYNRLIWMRPDDSYEVYDKRHLFRMADEHNYFSAGNERIIVNLKGFRICPMICYDLRFPVWSRNKNDYDVLIYIANWPEARNFAWKTLLSARAIENQCFVIGVNRIEKDIKNQSYSGDSAVLDAKGTILSNTKSHQENIETITISLQELEEFRKVFPAVLDADSFKFEK